MKLKVFSNGNGWYFPIGNYKDKSEKPLFVSVYFAQNYCPELSFVAEENGKCNKTIYVNECSFNKHTNEKGDLKISMTIFSYELLTDIELIDESKKFGAVNRVEPNDLPFY